MNDGLDRKKACPVANGSPESRGCVEAKNGIHVLGFYSSTMLRFLNTVTQYLVLRSGKNGPMLRLAGTCPVETASRTFSTKNSLSLGNSSC